MHFQSHAALGWLIGNAAPGSDRRLRAWCTAAAVLPDVEGVFFLAGPGAFSAWHHTVGHNAYVGAAASALAVWHHRDRPWPRRLCAGALVALAFMSHLVTDTILSEYAIQPLWPREKPLWQPWGFPLGHPINTVIVYSTMAVVVVLALWRKVTPIELLFPRLDRAFVNAFRAKPASCGICARACNETCDACARPVCSSHARLGLTRVACTECAAKRA